MASGRTGTRAEAGLTALPISPRARRLAAAALLAVLAAPPAPGQEVPGTASNYGGVGLLETRSARFRPDGTMEAGIALRQQRNFYYLSFQPLPMLETTFRLAERLNGTTGEGTTSDRAFDVKLRLLEEGDWTPALAIGLQDFIGTGIWSGEYLVASKRFGQWDATIGMGWGRLGTAADLPNPLGSLSDSFRSRSRRVGQGGTLNPSQYFHGEYAALFGGLEYSIPPLATPFGALDGLRAKIEYGGDALRDERGGWPARTTNLRGEAASRLNAGLQWSNGWLDAGLQWVNGSDLLFRISARLDPNHPPQPERRPPPPMTGRPAQPPRDPEEAIRSALREAGFRPVAVRLNGAEARIAVAGGRQRTLAGAAGRVLRAAQPHLPREVERILLSWRLAGAEIARVTLARGSMEAAARGAGSAEELFFASRLEAAGADEFGLMDGGFGATWALEPRFAALFGDPTRTLRWQMAAVAGARLELGHGINLAGGVAQALAGNLAGAPVSNSQLPRVRSDVARYAREGETSIPALYAERIWGLAPDVFARVSAGYLEPMFAGVAGEVLWRPHAQPWAVGLELAQVVQRDYPQGLGTLGYHVTTGHASVYADLPWSDLYTVVRAGRYLAGDWGGTVEVGRRFRSGIEVGAFATLTDVPFRTFGEGSFDRGIFVRLPLDLFGLETRTVSPLTIRGVTRDGGARLAQDNPLWEVTREGRAAQFEQGFMGFLR